MIQSVFYAFSSLISIYSFICLVRILLSWVPQFDYSPAGRFLASICDPYLNWFRRFSFARIGMVDFSPIIALGVLSVASMAFTTIARTGRISLGVIFAGLIQVLWSFFSFMLNILIIFLIIRLIYDFINRYSYSPFWTMLDRFLNPPIAWVTGLFFHKNGQLGYRASLILTLVSTIIVRVGIGIGLRYLVRLLVSLPI